MKREPKPKITNGFGWLVNDFLVPGGHNSGVGVSSNILATVMLKPRLGLLNGAITQCRAAMAYDGPLANSVFEMLRRG
jgi:hypothetical protein